MADHAKSEYYTCHGIIGAIDLVFIKVHTQILNFISIPNVYDVIAYFMLRCVVTLMPYYKLWTNANKMLAGNTCIILKIETKW